MSGMDRWAGKVTLVTGASSGIGTAVARRLRKAGMRVAVAARRESRLQALAEELGEEDTLVVPVDLTREDDIARMFDRIRARFGGVDVLVNNAGVGYSLPLLSDSTEKWREMLELNVLALCICTRHAVADMRARGAEGHVFHLSSLGAHRVTPGSGVYGASKVAVRWLTESLRIELHELGAPIRVTAVSPGFVESEFHEKYYQSREKALELYATQKSLSADDITDAIEYALGAPAHVQVHDIIIRSRTQRS